MAWHRPWVFIAGHCGLFFLLGLLAACATMVGPVGAPSLPAGALGRCVMWLDSDVRIWMAQGQAALPQLRQSQRVSQRIVEYLGRELVAQGYRSVHAELNRVQQEALREHLLLYERVADQAYDNLTDIHSRYRRRHLGRDYSLGPGLAGLGGHKGCQVAAIVRGFQSPRPLARPWHKPRLSIGLVRRSDGVLLWLQALDLRRLDLTDERQFATVAQRLLQQLPPPS